MEKRHKISVICLVYNEEERIKRFIESFYCYDEIVIIDKSSTDRTAEIAKKMGVKVVTVPYTDETTVWQRGIDNAVGDWVFLLTASDVAHPEFNKKLFEKIDDENFNDQYDIIRYPCIMHVLGIESQYSVFDYSYRTTLCKTKVIQIGNKVHEEITFKTNRVYTFDEDRKVAIHHLSHESIDMYYDRQLRYSKEEIKKGKTYKQCVKELFRELYIGIRKKFWKIGPKGFGLVLMMINYRILIYLRYMEADMGNVKEQYNLYAKEISNEGKNCFRNEVYELAYKKGN